MKIFSGLALAALCAGPALADVGLESAGMAAQEISAEGRALKERMETPSFQELRAQFQGASATRIRDLAVGEEWFCRGRRNDEGPAGFRFMLTNVERLYMSAFHYGYMTRTPSPEDIETLLGHPDPESVVAISGAVGFNAQVLMTPNGAITVNYDGCHRCGRKTYSINTSALGGAPGSMSAIRTLAPERLIVETSSREWSFRRNRYFRPYGPASVVAPDIFNAESYMVCGIREPEPDSVEKDPEGARSRKRKGRGLAR